MLKKLHTTFGSNQRGGKKRKKKEDTVTKKRDRERAGTTTRFGLKTIWPKTKLSFGARHSYAGTMAQEATNPLFNLNSALAQRSAINSKSFFFSVVSAFLVDTLSFFITFLNKRLFNQSINQSIHQSILLCRSSKARPPR